MVGIVELCVGVGGAGDGGDGKCAVWRCRCPDLLFGEKHAKQTIVVLSVGVTIFTQSSVTLPVFPSEELITISRWIKTNVR